MPMITETKSPATNKVGGQVAVQEILNQVFPNRANIIDLIQGYAQDAAQDGVLMVTDKKGEAITLEWHKTADHKTFFNWYNWLAPVIAETFADEAINFLLDERLQVKREYVEVIKQLSLNDQREIEDLIKLSSVSRPRRVEAVRAKLLQMIEIESKDSKSFSANCCVVIAKDSANKTLGFAIFQQDPEAEQNLAQELDLLAVLPEAQGRGLARFLIFSILTLTPKTKYIVLGTKSWNTKAQAVYKALGFTVSSQRPGNVTFEYAVKN